MKILEQLQAQLNHLEKIDYYRKRFADASVDPCAVNSLEDFARLPFTTAKDFQSELKKPPAQCSLFTPR